MLNRIRSIPTHVGFTITSLVLGNQLWSIPTHVGFTFHKYEYSFQITVHPHACGVYV